MRRRPGMRRSRGGALVRTDLLRAGTESAGATAGGGGSVVDIIEEADTQEDRSGDLRGR